MFHSVECQSPCDGEVADLVVPICCWALRCACFAYSKHGGAAHPKTPRGELLLQQTTVLSKTKKRCTAVFLHTLQFSCTKAAGKLRRIAVFLHTFAVFVNQGCRKVAAHCSFPAHVCSFVALVLQESCNVCRKTASCAGKLQCVLFFRFAKNLVSLQCPFALRCPRIDLAP